MMAGGCGGGKTARALRLLPDHFHVEVTFDTNHYDRLWMLPLYPAPASISPTTVAF